jgi:hypothetical protein
MDLIIDDDSLSPLSTSFVLSLLSIFDVDHECIIAFHSIRFPLVYELNYNSL